MHGYSGNSRGAGGDEPHPARIKCTSGQSEYPHFPVLPAFPDQENGKNSENSVPDLRTVRVDPAATGSISWVLQRGVPDFRPVTVTTGRVQGDRSCGLRGGWGGDGWAGCRLMHGCAECRLLHDHAGWAGSGLGSFFTITKSSRSTPREGAQSRTSGGGASVGTNWASATTRLRPPEKRARMTACHQPRPVISSRWRVPISPTQARVLFESKAWTRTPYRRLSGVCLTRRA